MEFLKDHFILDGQIKNKSEFTKYVEDLIRINFKLSNNICPINICSFAYTKNNKSMRVYAKCLYETDGCRKYKFCIDFCSIPFHAKVFTNKKNIFHPQCKKVQQIRGINRVIAKKEITQKLPANYRNELLLLL